MSDNRPFTRASFQHFLNEGKLMASYCPDSDRLYLPPRAICPQAHSGNMQWRELSGNGRLAAFTVISIGLSRMEAQGYSRDNPYCTGIVELEEGVRISAQILDVDATDPASIRIGSPVKVDFLEQAAADGDANKVLAFRLTAE